MQVQILPHVNTVSFANLKRGPVNMPVPDWRVIMYVYIRSEPGLWTVGFYTPDGKFEPESDHSNTEEAARRVAWLNGGPLEKP